MEKIKKFYAKQAWRIRQSSAMLNLFFFSLTLTGIYLPYVKEILNIDSNMLLLPMLYIISLIGLVLMGVVYDVVLRLWREENVVTAEHNPYAINLFSEKELHNLKNYQALIRLSHKSLQANVELCKRLGIDYGDLEEQMEKTAEAIDIQEEWRRTGRITRKIK